ncbi:NAD(P)-dependent oxidoreductase [Pedobacter foliorum]|uniref:NAD-dependent epimerase/dehydratase family protein n=1 Tax=Pedobacter foliorum TaxID=2739058 RepID=UPI001567128E|nr:SDR family oxidoreductase [Pedobacter foliorum]NRF39176.1 SDR family oxidoreductase [Pedobacter foliorum]
MNVFVTGHLGYIGVHLVKQLKALGHEVTGCDIDLFNGCEFEPFIRPDKELIKDIRNLTVEDLTGYDCIMHLAAISNDPMGDLDEQITYDVNLKGSVALAELAKKAGIKRFLFSGSCSVYGKGDKLDLSETDTLNPVSAYAISKIEAEKQISLMADAHFTPVYLRNATAYGFSPMLRIDLVVNNLLGCAHAKGEIRIMSDGSPWRPLIHCSDIAKAFVHLMTADVALVHNKAINIGGNEENYQVKDVADYVQKLVPSASIKFTGEVGDDPRNYRVNFDLLNTLVPGFKLDYTLAAGMEELNQKYITKDFNQEDFDGDRYVRLRTLKHTLNKIKQ